MRVTDMNRIDLKVGDGVLHINGEVSMIVRIDRQQLMLSHGGYYPFNGRQVEVVHCVEKITDEKILLLLRLEN